MDNITSLNRLIEVLKQSDAKDYVSVAKKMDIPLSDFNKYAHWKDHGYARNCIFKCDEFELILICWNEGDDTPIHCHNDQKCWVYLVDGKMTEIRYKEDEKGNLLESNRLEMTAGNLTYIEDSMGFHVLKTSPHQKAMSLHLYMKPINSCNVFNDVEHCFENRVLGFHTIDGKIIKQ